MKNAQSNPKPVVKSIQNKPPINLYLDFFCTSICLDTLKKLAESKPH